MQFYFEVINFKLKLRQIQQFVNFTKGKLYGHIQQRILRTQKKTKKSSQNKKTQHIKRVFCLHVLNCFVYLMSLIILLLLLLLFPSIFFASILDQKIARRRRKRIEQAVVERSENYLSCSWKIVCNFLSPRFLLFVNSLINNSNCYLITSRERIDLHVYGKNKRLLFILAKE